LVRSGGLCRSENAPFGHPDSTLPTRPAPAYATRTSRFMTILSSVTGSSPPKRRPRHQGVPQTREPALHGATTVVGALPQARPAPQARTAGPRTWSPASSPRPGRTSWGLPRIRLTLRVRRRSPSEWCRGGSSRTRRWSVCRVLTGAGGGGRSARSRSRLNRPGFDAASFLAKDARHAEEVSDRTT
jgi:hypothetical protein